MVELCHHTNSNFEEEFAKLNNEIKRVGGTTSILVAEKSLLMNIV